MTLLKQFPYSTDRKMYGIAFIKIDKNREMPGGET